MVEKDNAKLGELALVASKKFGIDSYHFQPLQSYLAYTDSKLLHESAINAFDSEGPSERFQYLMQLLKPDDAVLKELVWKSLLSEGSGLQLDYILKCYIAEGTLELVEDIHTLSKNFFPTILERCQRLGPYLNLGTKTELAHLALALNYEVPGYLAGVDNP